MNFSKENIINEKRLEKLIYSYIYIYKPNLKIIRDFSK